MFGFGQLIDILKKNPKKIVFTEGSDPRILEAASRLLAGTFLHPILVGNEEEIFALKNKIQELENGLEKVKQDEIDLENRKNSTRAGYVYIISNVGSFGENIYKIGMTRRLDPQIRVDELGSASVPFKFDVHAFIFSEDAFELESKLHNHFNNHRVNKVNTKKEFFNVTLEEIENYVKTLDGTAKFNRTAAADEYRASLVV